MHLAKENKHLQVIKYLEGQILLEPLHLLFTLENGCNIFAGSYDACTKELAVKFDINSMIIVSDTGKVRRTQNMFERTTNPT